MGKASKQPKNKTSKDKTRDQRGRPSGTRCGFPPPLVHPRDEFGILAETEDSIAQLLLWQRARDVRIWATTAPEDRFYLFNANTQASQSVAESAVIGANEGAGPLRMLAAMVHFPEVMHRSDICTACLALSEWAERNHLLSTALEYAEAAALFDPMNARAAAEAGQLCARAAADDRAEIWYERGRKIGRKTEDWEWYIRSYIRLGILRYEQGKFKEATRCAMRARNQAIWCGMLAFAGKAHHDMLLISMAVGSFPSADRHARAALEYYPDGYERLPYFAHDYAILLATFGRSPQALTILDAVLTVVTSPAERLVVLGTVAKAAAGAGDIARYNLALEDVAVLSQLYPDCAAGALALASEGGLALRDWVRATELATTARDIAARRHEREPLRRATIVIEAARAQQEPPHHPLADLDRARETTALVLERLSGLVEGQRKTDAGALSRGRAELTKFSIAGR